eukprot:COSAG02_NODE_1159_length_14178_cov_12.360679_2_plen_65_part_00
MLCGVDTLVQILLAMGWRWDGDGGGDGRGQALAIMGAPHSRKVALMLLLPADVGRVQVRAAASR